MFDLIGATMDLVDLSASIFGAEADFADHVAKAREMFVGMMAAIISVICRVLRGDVNAIGEVAGGAALGGLGKLGVKKLKDLLRKRQKRLGGTTDELLDDLRRNGVRHTPEDVVRIGRDPQGRVVFLENGNPSAGLKHIELRHAQDFANTGITRAEIPDLVMQAATRGRLVGITGRSRTVFEIEFKGRIRRVAVGISDNGFVVGANPVSMSRRLK